MPFDIYHHFDMRVVVAVDNTVAVIYNSQLMVVNIYDYKWKLSSVIKIAYLIFIYSR